MLDILEGESMNFKNPLADGPDDEELASAVRQLRHAYGETQEQFADRLEATIRTITHYETNRPPRGDALVRLWKMARRKSLDEIAHVFNRAFMRDFWRTLTDVGFMEKLYEYLTAVVGKQVEAQLLAKIKEDFLLDFKSGRVDVNLTDDEHAFLKIALANYRVADSTQRQLLVDFPGTLRRASWMLELEEKIHRSENRTEQGEVQLGGEERRDAKRLTEES